MTFLRRQLHCMNTEFISIQLILNVAEIKWAKEEITNPFSEIRFRCIYFGAKMVGQGKTPCITQCVRVILLRAAQ